MQTMILNTYKTKTIGEKFSYNTCIHVLV